MAYQAPAFYFYHGAREALSVVATGESAVPFEIHDGRQGEPFIFSTDIGTSDKQFVIERPDTPEADAIDNLIVSGHNWLGMVINVETSPTVVDLLSPNHTVVEADGTPIFVPFTATQDVLPDHENLVMDLLQGAAAGGVIPEVTEMFFTTKRTMSRGPEPNWDHPWVRAQRNFVNDSGVSSVWAKGAARKRFRLTWRHLFGDDRQIFLDMREQTNNWSEPFWFLPPDDIYDPLLVELERDSDWQQDFANPLDTGTSDAITLPLIEVTG